MYELALGGTAAASLPAFLRDHLVGDLLRLLEHVSSLSFGWTIGIVAEDVSWTLLAARTVYDPPGMLRDLHCGHVLREQPIVVGLGVLVHSSASHNERSLARRVLFPTKERRYTLSSPSLHRHLRDHYRDQRCCTPPPASEPSY